MTDPRMTPTNDAPVTVEQCDREAAADLGGYPHQEWIRSGQYDRHPYVQAFARHRLAALASAPAGDGVSLTAQLASIKNAARYVPIGDGAYDPYGSAAEAVDAAVDRLAAALDRPRAAVGEQQVLDELIRQFGRDGMPLTQEIYAPVARAFLALQSPPAKETE